MLSNIQKNIIIKAVQIRFSNGEDLEVIINSYSRLTNQEKEEIKEIYQK